MNEAIMQPPSYQGKPVVAAADAAGGPQPAPPQQQRQATMLVLISSMSLDRNVQQQQDRAMTLLRAKGISFETIDGAQAVNKERRNDLFAMSGLRGKYPQFFLVQPHQAQTLIAGNS